MKTLREYLERNNYSIVNSLAEMLAISPEEATDFYKSISTFDEGKVVDALKDNASDDEKSFIADLYNKYQNNEINETKQKSYTTNKAPTGKNTIKFDKNDRHASKAAGGPDPSKQLGNIEFRNRAFDVSKRKPENRQDAKSKIKRGMYENTVVPVLVHDNGYKFKIVESSLVSKMDNIEAIFESAIMVSPIGGLTSVPGVGMNSLRKMAGIDQYLPSDELEVTELESPDVNDILSIISQMDDDSRACLINMLSQPECELEPQLDAETLAMVKEALCSFGGALQTWIEEANGGLDFLCPLVDSLWVKYNEC